MTYVITQSCCKDSACVPACPVNCIHPTVDDPDFHTAEMLYIDPEACIECGACVDVCPVTAITADWEMPAGSQQFLELNAAYYRDPAKQEYPSNAPTRPPLRVADGVAGPLRVAVVGSGPAGSFTALELLTHRGVETRVDVFERLPAPWGLVRFGVAPDHQNTKGVIDTFSRMATRKGFRLLANVEVGRDVTHEQLRDNYHAVVYAVGAPDDRRLGIPGEDLPGSHSATEFVAWYNGHPDFTDRVFDLSSERAVVIGNGNVALDVARILLADVDALARTDISDHALEQLAASNVREVVVVGRRGPRQAAFTTSELLGLLSHDAVSVTARGAEVGADADDAMSMTSYKAALIAGLTAGTTSAARRIELRFFRSPVEITGGERVEGVRLARTELGDNGGRMVAVPTAEVEFVECGLVFRSVGYRGAEVPGLPFDEFRGVLPNQLGRVIVGDEGHTLPGVYTTGWIKRGPTGVIGTNRSDARETAASLLHDFEHGLLTAPADPEDLALSLPDHVDVAGWKAIDASERAAGRDRSRPRVKLVDRAELIRTARTRSANPPA